VSRDFEFGINVSCKESTVSTVLFYNGVTEIFKEWKDSVQILLLSWRWDIN